MVNYLLFKNTEIKNKIEIIILYMYIEMKAPHGILKPAPSVNF